MNPENLTHETLTLFNSLDAVGQREATELTESFSENEAVYLAALRQMPTSERRRLIFALSRKKWGL